MAGLKGGGEEEEGKGGKEKEEEKEGEHQHSTMVGLIDLNSPRLIYSSMTAILSYGYAGQKGMQTSVEELPAAHSCVHAGFHPIGLSLRMPRKKFTQH